MIKHLKAINQGFTLLELLLALLLSILLMTILTVGMNSITRDWEKQETWLNQEIDESLILLQLERALLATFPHHYRDDDSLEKLIYFNGQTEQLTWVSTVSPARYAGLSAWSLENREEGVYLKIVPAYANNPEDYLETVEARKILDNVRIEVQYMYLNALKESVWINHWQGSETYSLPRAVFIRFFPLDLEQSKNEKRYKNLHLLIPLQAWRHADSQVIPREPVH